MSDSRNFFRKFFGSQKKGYVSSPHKKSNNNIGRNYPNFSMYTHCEYTLEKRNQSNNNTIPTQISINKINNWR